MLRIFVTFAAAVFGLAFGSFLNVCAARLPEGESIISPGSHCRSCSNALRWYENIPLLSWIFLRGRCSNCRELIGIRYPLIELAVACTWAIIAWQHIGAFTLESIAHANVFDACVSAAAKMILCWLLILLAVLDAEFLWLPNRLTLGGSLLGLPFVIFGFGVRWVWQSAPLLWNGAAIHPPHISGAMLHWLIGIVVAPCLILVPRRLYWLIRHREGVGLGDAKLMLLLAVWLGLGHSLLAFFIGVILGAAFAFVVLLVPAARRGSENWALTQMPLGTFLCLGGILSTLWGTPVIAAYLRSLGL
jgi:leader peptidase (prepilin peptidase)/N-methyltransferase